MQDYMNVLLKTQEEKILQEGVSLTTVGNFLSPSLPLFFALEIQTTLGYFWDLQLLQYYQAFVLKNPWHLNYSQRMKTSAPGFRITFLINAQAQQGCQL